MIYEDEERRIEFSESISWPEASIRSDTISSQMQFVEDEDIFY